MSSGRPDYEAIFVDAQVASKRKERRVSGYWDSHTAVLVWYRTTREVGSSKE